MEELYQGGADSLARNYWAATTPNPSSRMPSTDEDDANEASDTVDLTLEPAAQHEWLVFLLSYFAHLGGLASMTKVSRECTQDIGITSKEGRFIDY